METPYVLTFTWTVADVMNAAKSSGIVITDEQASTLLEKHADELAEVEGAAVTAALVDIIGETFDG